MNKSLAVLAAVLASSFALPAQAHGDKYKRTNKEYRSNEMRESDWRGEDRRDRRDRRESHTDWRQMADNERMQKWPGRQGGLWPY